MWSCMQYAVKQGVAAWLISVQLHTSGIMPATLGSLNESKQGWKRGGWRRTMEPMAPFPGVGKKAMRAVSAVRTLQLGCQCSGWWLEMDRQIFTPVSKRPLGDSSRKLGGLKGYSGGSRMRPW